MLSKSIHCSKDLLKRSLYSIRYTRQFFEDLNIDRQAIRKNQQLQAQQAKKQYFKNLKCNDKNPNNFIKNLKIDHQALNHFSQRRENLKVLQCHISRPESKKTPVLFSAARRYILTTLKKATLVMRPIKKMYLMDAISVLEQSQKKVAKLMVRTLYNLIRHAIQKDRDPSRLYIHGVIVGKTLRHRGIRYHAKGKTGLQQRDYCQIKVIVQEKDEQQFYTKVATGEAPANFAHLIRHRLRDINASYEQISSCVGITTAKGRQQKKQLVKRKIFLTVNENKKNGIYVPKKQIEKKIKQEQYHKVKQLLDSLKQKESATSLKLREQTLKKNLGVQ